MPKVNTQHREKYPNGAALVSIYMFHINLKPKDWGWIMAQQHSNDKVEKVMDDVMKPSERKSKKYVAG